MEEVENVFSPEFIYGEYLDDIMGFLSMKMSDVDEKCKSEFASLVDKHIRRMWQTKPSSLTPFEDDLEWLNTSRPLSFDQDLGKKIFAMDFFTYCCINCIHILPYLKEVEVKYNRPDFAVIGIHSPKFPNEKDLARLKEALVRNDIKHPVLHDSDCKLWEKYGINCWPTVFVVGPAHTLMFVLIGETQIEKLSFLIDRLFYCIFNVASEDVLDGSPIPTSSSLFMKCEVKEADLLFPGNISASSDGDKVIVSDTGHNRLILMSKLLEVKEIIGNGIIGCKDGPFNLATFNSPHGTAWQNNMVYVADTGNHSIRRVDLDAKVVLTIFKNTDYVPDIYDKSTYEKKFFSPWDVCIGPQLNSDLPKLSILYIAVAGSHQIWALNLEEDSSREGYCVPFAGSGKEENRPNLYRLKAGFAQPSGISYSSLSPNHLFVADSESSTIKSIALKGGAVKTIVGGGLDPINLFQFGDEDGVHVNAKLQHPMSVCVIRENTLAITDTYNHKIKLVKVKERKCETFDVGVSLCEPSDICLLDDKLLIADTNNHRIVPICIFDVTSKLDQVTFDEIVESFNISPHESCKTSVVLATEGKIFCYFNLRANTRYELSEGGRIKLDSITITGNGKLDAAIDHTKTLWEAQPFLTLKPIYTEFENFEGTASEVNLSVILPICDKEHKVCCPKKKTFKVLVMFSRKGLKSVRLNFNASVE